MRKIGKQLLYFVMSMGYTFTVGRICEMEVDTMNSLGFQVQRRRERLSLTQQKLADRMGVAVARISEIERGCNEDPRLSTLVSLAKALETSLPDLLKRAVSA